MMSDTKSIKHSIYWFRKALRLHDNPALLSACEGCRRLYPIFVLDPWFVENAQVGANRWRFLQQSLQDLDNSLRKLNSRLFVIKGKPEDIFQRLFKEWKIDRLAFEIDSEPYAVKRDAVIEKLCHTHGVEVIKQVSHTLYDLERTIDKNDGKAPLTYQSLQGLLSKIGPPPKPVCTLSEEHLKGTEKCSISEDQHRVPSLPELGVQPSDVQACKFPGGEREALLRMENCLKKTKWICSFEKPKTSPNSLEPSTTVLSPYLKFGCISARTMYHRIKDVYKQNKQHSQPPVSLEGQLLWREFFYTVGASTPNFDRMEGNPICKQIPWQRNEEHLEAWRSGKTGFPFIDAVMIQLRQEGWIHHLGRHAVACFLTRGDLWVSWEEGMKVFEELLLDADWSLNAGNWMWLSASAFFHQYFRLYSPIAFGKKTDKNGEFIKKYLPQLKKYPAEYIYEPWKAPKSLQERAGCIIGKDYPKPIVDHDVVRKVNIDKMAKAYQQSKAADAKSSGSAAKNSQKAPKGKKRKITDFID